MFLIRAALVFEAILYLNSFIDIQKEQV